MTSTSSGEAAPGGAPPGLSVRFEVVESAPPVGGELRYEPRALSFDFHPAQAATVRRTQDAVELAFGSLAVPLDRDTGELLGVWGYHPDAGWLRGSLGSPTTAPARLRAVLPKVSRGRQRGVARRLVHSGDLTTIQDTRTGWIRVGRTGVTTGNRYIEFATGCLAELAADDLVALWLRPTATVRTR